MYANLKLSTEWPRLDTCLCKRPDRRRRLHYWALTLLQGYVTFSYILSSNSTKFRFHPEMSR